MAKKDVVDVHSYEYKRGFMTCLDISGWPTPYSINTGYSKYREFKAGCAQANKEIRMYGRERVNAYFRFNLCLSAVGKPEEEIKEIIRDFDGKIHIHEFRAVILYLHNNLKGFEGYNKGVEDFLKGNGNVVCPYNEADEYNDHIDWHAGSDAAELAIKLHGRETVVNHVRRYK